METTSRFECAEHSSPAISLCLRESCPAKFVCAVCQPTHSKHHIEAQPPLLYPMAYLLSGRTVDDFFGRYPMSVDARKKELEKKTQGLRVRLTSFAKAIEDLAFQRLRKESMELRVYEIYARAKQREREMLDAPSQVKQESLTSFAKEFTQLVNAVEAERLQASDGLLREIDLIFERCEKGLAKLVKDVQAFGEKKDGKASLASLHLIKEASRKLLSESVVMKSPAEFDYVSCFFPNAKLNLLYRASRDGFDSKQFHARCDGKGPTITVVRANGKAFGGYTDQSWDCSYQWKKSEASFLFSVTDKQKFSIKERLEAIRGHLKCGPRFGDGDDLYLSSDCNANSRSCSILSRSYNGVSDEGKEYTSLAGRQSFKVDDYEVYAVIKVD